LGKAIFDAGEKLAKKKGKCIQRRSGGGGKKKKQGCRDEPMKREK